MKAEKKNKTNEMVPAKSELEVLKILWKHGPSTVRFVHDTLNKEIKTVQYTSTLKLMQIMTEKGLVVRDESQRAHVYHPAWTEQKTQRQLMNDLVERAFAGSPMKLVMQALSTKKATPQELDEIRDLLQKMEGETR